MTLWHVQAGRGRGDGATIGDRQDDQLV